MPAASTIKLFVYSAFRRTQLNGSETAAAPATGGDGVSEHLQTPLSLAAHAFLMLTVSDNASTNLLLLDASEMLQALRIAANLKSFLPYLLPEATVAAKWGDTETVRHEVAYITQGDLRVVTPVCSSPPEPPDVLARVAAQRAEAASGARAP